MLICVYEYIYIYMYLERERYKEREREIEIVYTCHSDYCLRRLDLLDDRNVHDLLDRLDDLGGTCMVSCYSILCYIIVCHIIA